MDVSPHDIQELVLECARLREERDALLASVKERTAKLVESEQRITAALLRANEDRCELNHERAKRAEAENERDELTTKCVVYVVRLAEVERERDEARRVAKRLAGWCYVTCPAKYHDTILTALAYEVEP